MNVAKKVSKIIFVVITAITLASPCLVAMDRSPDEIFMDMVDLYLTNDVLDKPQALCQALCDILAWTSDYEKMLSATLRQRLQTQAISLAGTAGTDGNTALHLACMRTPNLQTSAPILLDATPDDQVLNFISAQNCIDMTPLHYAAIYGIEPIVTFLISAADRYAQNDPQKIGKIAQWLRLKSVCGKAALELAEGGVHLFDDSRHGQCVEILKQAETKYSL